MFKIDYKPQPRLFNLLFANYCLIFKIPFNENQLSQMFMYAGVYSWLWSSCQEFLVKSQYLEILQVVFIIPGNSRRYDSAPTTLRCQHLLLHTLNLKEYHSASLEHNLLAGPLFHAEAYSAFAEQENCILLQTTTH